MLHADDTKDDPWEPRDAYDLKEGDVLLVEAGDTIPADGEVIEGIASVNESAITGESAPVIRESGGDRSAVTGGTVVLSDWIKVRVTAAPGSSFLDRMIALVEGAERQKTPNELALSILLSGMTLILLITVVTLWGLAGYSGTALSVGVTSNEIVISGINSSAPVSITGGEYSIDGGAFTAAAGSVANNQRIRVRLTTSGEFSTSVSAVLTVGGVSASFAATTRDPDTTPDGFEFEPLRVAAE